MSQGDQHDRLCELNVLEQVANICRTTIVTDAWERGQELSVHALVYGVHDGLLEALSPTISNVDECSKNLAVSLERYKDLKDIR
jgi:carbonic anhydrase